jgi:hypothetical protein
MAGYTQSAAARAIDAKRRRGVGFETPIVDVVTATQAFAKAAIVDAAEGCIYPRDFRDAPLLRRIRHCLGLQRVHARQAADALLIEHHRFAAFSALFAQRIQLGPAGVQQRSGAFFFHGAHDDRALRRCRRRTGKDGGP